MADNNLSQFAQLQRDNPSGFVEGGQFYKSQSDYDKGNALNNSGQSAPMNFDSVLKKAVQMAQETVKPAVSSLTASIPEIQSRFAQEKTRLQGQVQPLSDRYSSLLDEIKGNQQTATEQQTVATANELGRRGVSTTSGLGEQTIASSLLPVNRTFTPLIQQTGLSREADLSALQNQITGLTGQETTSLRDIQNAIAQLQSGAATGAVPTALSLLGSQQQASQFAQQQDFARQQLAQQQSQFDTTTALSKKANDLAQATSNSTQAFLESLRNQQQPTNVPTEGLPSTALDDATKDSLFNASFLGTNKTPNTQSTANRVTSNLSLIPQGISQFLNNLVPSYGTQAGAGKGKNDLLSILLRGGKS